MADAEHVWVRTMAGWHAAFAVLAFAAALAVGMQEDAAPERRIGALVLLGVLGAWYAMTGARALHRERGWLGLVYVLVACSLGLAMFAFMPVTAMMMSILGPHVWAMLPRARAIGVTCALTVGMGFVMVLPSGGVPLRSAAPILVTTLASALAIGLWIDRIIKQSQRRAELIDELASTRAKLARANREAGVLAERERLSRDLHDTLAQGSTSVLMLLQAARRSLRHDPDASEGHLDLAEQTTRENLGEIHSLVNALKPDRLDGVTLPAALRRLTEQLAAELDTSTTMTVHGEHRELLTEMEVTILRATQEALANVRKHAAARKVAVDLSYGDAEVVLTVTDDGHGFDSAERRTGFGLDGLRDRLDAVGGRLSVSSAPGDGVRVQAVMPQVVTR